MIDDFLVPEALETLRAFALESAIYSGSYIQGYQGTFLADGFGASGLVLQVRRRHRRSLTPAESFGARLSEARGRQLSCIHLTPLR